MARQSWCAAALAGLVAALAFGPVRAQQPVVDPPPALRSGDVGPLPQKKAYRGRYPVVGKPVRNPKRQLQKPPPPPRPIDDIAAGPSALGVSRPPLLPETFGPKPRRRSAAEVDPYAPLGVRAGSFLLRPSLEQNVGYDTNPNRLSGHQKGSAEFRTEGALAVASDWERHSLTAALRGAYAWYPSVISANRPDADAALDLRLDALRDTRIDLGATYRLYTQQPGSIEQPLVGTSRAFVQDLGAAAGVTQTFGRLAVGLRGSVARTIYDPLDVGDGTQVSQADRNVTAYNLRLRTGYEATPGVQPYVEVNVSRRQYDQQFDNSGYERSSNGLNGRIGSTFEISRILTGDINVGYGEWTFDDPRLAPLRGPVADASLIWAATPLTTVTLRGTASFSDTIVSGSSGATLRGASVEVSHALLRNLTIAANAGFTRTVYEGDPIREDGFTGGVRVEYRLTRAVAVKASFTHERLNSTQVGTDYTANVYRLGLKLQF
ncbi:MAG: outer membrane beta-barrel protein [Alsobacter sp.]